MINRNKNWMALARSTENKQSPELQEWSEIIIDFYYVLIDKAEPFCDCGKLPPPEYAQTQLSASLGRSLASRSNKIGQLNLSHVKFFLVKAALIICMPQPASRISGGKNESLLWFLE